MYGTANAIASSADKTFSYIPDCSDLQFPKMLIMYIYARTILSMEPNLKLSQIQKARL